MAISTMQQPRQMYGLGSFVKKAVRKVTKPFTKVAKKIVPKEVAGIMRVAAPFLPPGYREAAYLLGTAKQTGRISPVDLALVSVPYLNKAAGKTDAGFFAEQFPKANEFLFGAKGFTDTPVNRLGMVETASRPATSGIFGKGGEMFQLGKGFLPGTGAKQSFGILDTKAGEFLLGGKGGGLSKSKLAGIGIGTLSLIQNSKTPDEAGENLVAQTGNSDDYERGVELFSRLNPELFRVPEQFRLQSKDGGLMRSNYAMGSGMKMAEFDMQDYMQEFERVFPEMRGKRGTQEYMDMLEDYFRGLASKNKEGIMMAGSLGDEKDDISKEIFGKPVKDLNPSELEELMEELERLREKFRAAKGGRANLALGSMPTAQESGLGGLPIEADMRYTGGFMPYGAKEKADDVPARLSKNEFVFTADAVRAAGGGSVQKGAQKMYNTMKQLEAKPEAKGMMA